jgi:hypothetical protein
MSNATAQFTPVLQAYITSDYQETQILRGAIQSPLVWSQDLALLPAETTNYVLSRDAAGVYHMTEQVNA